MPLFNGNGDPCGHVLLLLRFVPSGFAVPAVGVVEVVAGGGGGAVIIEEGRPHHNHHHHGGGRVVEEVIVEKCASLCGIRAVSLRLRGLFARCLGWPRRLACSRLLSLVLGLGANVLCAPLPYCPRRSDQCAAPSPIPSQPPRAGGGGGDRGEAPPPPPRRVVSYGGGRVAWHAAAGRGGGVTHRRQC